MELYDMTEFLVTEDHIKLVEKFYVKWFDCEYGAPCIDPKRPYGNSGVVNDIADILGWEIPEYGTPEWDEMSQKCGDIHQETQVVLQILTCHAREGIRPGLYEMTPMKVRQWRRADFTT